MTKVSDIHIFYNGHEVDLGVYSASFCDTRESSLLLIKLESIIDQNFISSLRFNGGHIDVDVVFKDIESQQFYHSNGIAICYNLIKAQIVIKQIQISFKNIQKCSASETLLWGI